MIESHDAEAEQVLALVARVRKLEEALRICRIKTIGEAQDLGYLDHRADCEKGTTSKTCTCGIMTWLAKEPSHA